MNNSEKDLIKSSLLTVLCNATQIYRGTISAKQKGKYRKELKRIVIKLTRKIDNETLTNRDIRKAIMDLSKFCDSIGASQKAINVYLKFYSIIAGKDVILKQLDCPIDSFVIKQNGLKRVSLRKLDLEQYREMQNKLERDYKGMRILADVKAWDMKKSY